MVEAERPRRRSLHQPRQDRMAASTQAVAVGVVRSTQVLDHVQRRKTLWPGIGPKCIRERNQGCL